MSNEQEKERLRKQQYLIDAIQKQNYNTKAFEDFLLGKKDNGQNIEVWTFAELQDLVYEFTHTQDKLEQEKEKTLGPFVPPLSYRNSSSPFGQSEVKAQDAGAANHPLFANSQAERKPELLKEDDAPKKEAESAVDQSMSLMPSQKAGQSKNVTKTTSGHGGLAIHFEPRVQTKMVIPTRLSEIETAQIDVQVEDGLWQQKKSLLSTTHFLTFKIKIPLLKTDVRRQDEDFDQLMIYLKKEYPHLIVPIIKTFKVQKQVSNKYVNKRSTMLTRFIKTILRNRILRGDQFLMHFLSERNDDQYKKARTAMQKREAVIKLDDFVTYSSVHELTEDRVEEMRSVLWPKLKQAAMQTEKGYVYLHEQMRRLSQDISVAGQTVDNIRDAFQTLLRTSYHFQVSGGTEVQEVQEEVKFFLKCSMETFTQWGTQLQQMSEFLQRDQAKFFQNLALEGERIGQMQRAITDLNRQHDDGMQALKEKQDKLFNQKDKDFSKWGNPDLVRMTVDDQLELLRDTKNKQLIDPDTQRKLWKMRQTHAFLTKTLNDEMEISQQWAVYDIRANFAELIKFMKDASAEHNALWTDFEGKILPQI